MIGGVKGPRDPVFLCHCAECVGCRTAAILSQENLSLLAAVGGNVECVPDAKRQKER